MIFKTKLFINYIFFNIVLAIISTYKVNYNYVSKSIIKIKFQYKNQLVYYFKFV